MGASLSGTPPLDYDQPYRNYGSDYTRAAAEANRDLTAAFFASFEVGYVPGRRK